MARMSGKWRYWLLIALLAIGCRSEAPPASQSATGPADQSPADVSATWEPLFVGIERCAITLTDPRLMRIYALRVDLHEPGIDFLVTPSNGPAPMDCAARTTAEFLHEFKCQAAINGSPYGQPAAGKKGDPLDVLGLSLSRGKRYSLPGRYPALLIDEDNRARIAEPPVRAQQVFNGLSGYDIILRDGRNLGDDSDRHPRSVAGVSGDGRYLILMAIDGRQQGYSESATTRETAEIIRKLGADDALNLDGGGSTTLVIEGPDGHPVTLNRPSGVFQRHVANHLGIFARRLPQTAPKR